jgi:hypothetical protein
MMPNDIACKSADTKLETLCNFASISNKLNEDRVSAEMTGFL